jgi:hypothetical protein
MNLTPAQRSTSIGSAEFVRKARFAAKPQQRRGQEKLSGCGDSKRGEENRPEGQEEDRAQVELEG